jgi:hypothetical protein
MKVFHQIPRAGLFILLFLVLVIRPGLSSDEADLAWTLVWVSPDGSELDIHTFYHPPTQSVSLDTVVDRLHFSGYLVPDSLGGAHFNFRAETLVDSARGFFSFRLQAKEGEMLTFNGPVSSEQVYRQSPHDPSDHAVDMVKQAVPMVACKLDTGTLVAISNAPAFSDNKTTQRILPDRNEAWLNSGDRGEQPGTRARVTRVRSRYHRITTDHAHWFSGLLLDSKSDSLSDLRTDVFRAITRHWGEFSDTYGAVAFASNYMHLRRNETGRSRYWICPGIDYANKQYTRDAFWQTTVLPLKWEQECYQNEVNARTPGAERPLLTLIWSFRIAQRGGHPDLAASRKLLRYIESQTRNGLYFAVNDSSRRNMQSWYDLCSFEADDVITYNQGLLAVALLAAESLGLNPSTPPERAIQQYRDLFLPDKGYYPMSRKKPVVCMDALVGDLLAQILFGTALLPSEDVRRHYDTIMSTARTPYGFKITCMESGDYLPRELYTVPGFDHPLPQFQNGYYCYGGSYFLYDLLCLMDCYLHGIEDAEEQMIWRTRIDFERGGTYHEHIHTVTGEAEKPNQGWNAAIYGLWNELIEQGRVDDRYIESIDQMLTR